MVTKRATTRATGKREASRQASSAQCLLCSSRSPLFWQQCPSQLQIWGINFAKNCPFACCQLHLEINNTDIIGHSYNLGDICIIRGLCSAAALPVHSPSARRGGPCKDNPGPDGPMGFFADVLTRASSARPSTKKPRAFHAQGYLCGEGGIRTPGTVTRSSV